MKRRVLKWGQTPWDDMTREQLLREVQRAYNAADSAKHVLTMLSNADRAVGFWNRHGAGGRALAKCTDVVRRVEDVFDSESVYRAFFRYAVDLLFSPEQGVGWSICENGHLLGADNNGKRTTTCSLCALPMRPIEWKDLAPKPTP